MRRVRRLRAEISPHDGAARFRDMGVDVFFGEAAFSGPGTLSVAGVTLRFLKGIIATGGRPRIPDIPGLTDVPFFTSHTIFTVTDRPERLVVIGAGPIGCELAQAFARLGGDVTLIDSDVHILPREEPDAAAVVLAALEQDGVRCMGSVRVVSVQSSGAEVIVHAERGQETLTISGTHLLVATGRSPNVESLRLDQAGVDFDTRGIHIDQRLRTSNHRLFAVGDVTSRYQFTHVADAQARIAVRNALFFGRERADRLVVPRVTYTSPELARVGLSAAEAKAAGMAVDTITVRFADVDRAQLDGETAGFLRVHLKKGTDRLAGATMSASTRAS